MKATGIIKRIDKTGHIMIPKGVRQAMHLKAGDPMEIFIKDNHLLFRKYSPFASAQNSLNDLKEIILDGQFSPNRDKVLRKIKELENLLEEKEEVQE